MKPIQRKVISRLVLEILHTSKPWAMPVETLLSHVNLLSVPPITLSELISILNSLEIGKAIVQATIDDVLKASITDNGEMELLKT